MWIRINDFIINLGNVTNINISKELVYVSFNHGITNLGHEGADNIYWNSLAFKKDEIPIDALSLIYQLPKMEP